MLSSVAAGEGIGQVGNAVAATPRLRLDMVDGERIRRIPIGGLAVLAYAARPCSHHLPLAWGGAPFRHAAAKQRGSVPREPSARRRRAAPPIHERVPVGAHSNLRRYPPAPPTPAARRPSAPPFPGGRRVRDTAARSAPAIPAGSVRAGRSRPENRA